MPAALQTVVAKFGVGARAKLANPGASGEPEDQLRAPLDTLLADLAELCGFRRADVVAVGESSLSDLKTRPDFAVTVRDALVGFVEVKAPGKGADPARYKGHDKAQWDKLRSLPNLIYTDGNQFSLWRSGELQGSIVHLTGDVEHAGAALGAPDTLLALFESFFHWQPVAPRSAKQLAETTARLCRLLREEVIEQMTQGSAALTALAADWRKLLFPEATDPQFADGYAQAVTFGMLMARARGIELGAGLDAAAKALARTSSLIGTALRLLTDDATNQATLKTSLATLTRVLDAVDWQRISKGRPDAWLYFYEDFLQLYDNKLRKLTGSYYTPPEVVEAMVRLVDDTLRTHFGLGAGLAAPNVTVADPALGTGTFLLGVLRRIATTYEQDEGPGAVPAAVESALSRLIGFELQLGPFAVAQLRMLAEFATVVGHVPGAPMRLFVTDTLGNPYAEQESLGSVYAPIAESKRQANAIKRQEPITVVIGNPPYKEKAKGRGGWVEAGSPHDTRPALLKSWMPPADWGISAHARHLYNLYVYFWRWAVWKVFEQGGGAGSGIVCFITAAGFLDGTGFEKMRDDLRRTCDDVWVIDCSPEGLQPEVSDRVFEGVQQPVCIVLASRSGLTDRDTPARVRFRVLPKQHRRDKLAALGALTLDDENWLECPSEWRAPFAPASSGAWATFPRLSNLFRYDGTGVMAGRTWIFAPDARSLQQRWRRLLAAQEPERDVLFQPHMRGGKPGDKHASKVMTHGLPGHIVRTTSVAKDTADCETPVRYAFRSFDRQWIIPDARLINQPNPTLWASASTSQVFATASMDHSPTGGPAVTFAASVPDAHHYNGRGGRVFPLWSDAAAQSPNVRQTLLALLTERYGTQVGADDVMAYLAAVAAHPAFTERFQPDLTTPGIRIPITADAALFAEAATLGREVIWLHTFGERCADSAAGRPASPPRILNGQGPRIPAGGAIPSDPPRMPDEIRYDEAIRRLHVGHGYIDNVDPRVWAYEVSGKQVVKQWFSYRRKTRDRPVMGDRRPPSKLGEIQPDHWLAEYTSELLNVLHVLGRLVELEPRQGNLLDRICAGPLISVDDLRVAGVLDEVATATTRRARPNAEPQGSFL